MDGIKYIYVHTCVVYLSDTANIKGLTKNAETAMVELPLVVDPHPGLECGVFIEAGPHARGYLSNILQISLNQGTSLII